MLKNIKIISQALCLMLLVSISNLSADVTITIVDVDNRIMRTTYMTDYSQPGQTYAVFPVQNGYTFPSGPLEVVSVTELNTEQNLAYSVIETTNPEDQQVRIEFPNPVPSGGSFRVQIVAQAPTNNIKIDDDGRYVFSFMTARDNVFFILPEGHAIVYSNYPVLIYERQGRTVAHIKQSGMKELLFNTRRFEVNR